MTLMGKTKKNIEETRFDERFGECFVFLHQWTLDIESHIYKK